MRLVTRDDIVRWGKTYEAKGDFPILIAKLILASTPINTRLRFPSGSAVFLSGWDGRVECETNTHFVRKGISLFEIGTERNPVQKIERDYQKRTLESSSHNKSDITFVLITCFTWNEKKKEDWVKQKNEDKIWKEVIVYDAIDIELWLENCIVVARWFLPKIGKTNSEGFLLAEESWREWSTAHNIELPPNIIVVGREKECDELLNILNDKPTLIGVRASTRNEAIAFIIANGKLFTTVDSERFFSKTLVINSINDYRVFARQNLSSLILIANIDDSNPLYSAVTNGHFVFVPLGAQDVFNQKTIELPVLDRDSLIKILVDLEINEDQAKRYVLESGRNITILKKFLGFPELSIYTEQKKNVREVIPALLLGRWIEGFEGDIELIEKLSGQNHSEYSVILNRWKNINDSPLIHISNVWRLTSPLDLWTSVSKYITNEDLESLKECFKTAFFNGNPDIESNDDLPFSSLFKSKKFSNWSREGLCHSLILVGLRGDALQMPHSQQWVDSIIKELLFDASAELWISVNNELPLIAEASPKSFLNAVSNSLEKKTPEIIEMFREEEGMFGSDYHYTGLLWGLESLAWHPEYLFQSSMILIKLDSIIPEPKRVNSPMNSLVEIFKSWHYQTLATYEDRMEVLKQITAKEKESGWKLLIKLLPKDHDIANSTHKTRWRIFDQNTNLKYLTSEVVKTYRYILALLISLFDGNEFKFSDLINSVVTLPYQEDRLKVYDWAEKVCVNIQQKEYEPWYTIREILHHHRSYPDADWSLSESELIRLEAVYNKLEPIDIVEKYKWFFDRYWPAFPKGIVELDSDLEKYEKNNEARVSAAKVWLKELGLDKTLYLRKELKDPKLLAEALSYVINEKDDIVSICECFKGDSEDVAFGEVFIRHKSYKEKFEWIENLVFLLQEKGFDEKSISNILVSVDPIREVYDYINTLPHELQNAYWMNENVHFGAASTDDAILVINKLNSYKRFYTAIKVISDHAKDLPIGLILNTLQLAYSEESQESVFFDKYELEKIFEVLYKNEDIEKSRMIKIEWRYIFLFDGYFPLKPKYLQDELAENPEFFIEVIKWVYFPNDKERYYEGKEGVSEEKISIIAKQSKVLLDSWYKLPGTREDKSLDSDKLLDWIIEARRLAKESDRLEVADMEIGTLLSRMPEDNDEIPSEEIFRVIEEINSKDLNISYSMGLRNKRGSTVRGPFDGGEIERAYAAFFKELADKYKMKFPNVSQIFKDLEQEYLSMASYEDDRARIDSLEY